MDGKDYLMLIAGALLIMDGIAAIYPIQSAQLLGWGVTPITLGLVGGVVAIFGGLWWIGNSFGLI